MTLWQKTQALREQLRQWASEPEWDLMVRYELLPQKPLPVWHQRMSQRGGRLLRVLGLSRSRYCTQRWHPGLKHGCASPDAQTLLLWADVSEPGEMRDACLGMKDLLRDFPNFAPVLATSMADFAFYSRLGWLVEYLPDLPGHGTSYLERKRRYLAWRYRNALALPLSAGLASPEVFTALLKAGEYNAQ